MDADMQRLTKREFYAFILSENSKGAVDDFPSAAFFLSRVFDRRISAVYGIFYPPKQHYFSSKVAAEWL